MAWTYGSTTAADTTMNVTAGIASGAIAFMAGWIYPTTLTATRTFFSIGSNYRVEIDTTTTQLRLRTDNTTDGQWTTSDAGLAVNTWRFIAAILSPLNTGPVCAWRVWAGGLETPPAELTVTNAVSPAGNFTGATSFTMGNAGSLTVSFQGSIESFVFGNFNGTLNATTGVFPIAAAGTITQAEADLIRDRFVIPIWKGDLYPYEKIRSGLPATTGGLNWYVVRTDNTVQLASQNALRATIGAPAANLTANNSVTDTAVRGPVPPLPGQHVTFRSLHRLR